LIINSMPQEASACSQTCSGKEIYFYGWSHAISDTDAERLYHSWGVTSRALQKNFEIIHTTQMALLSTSLFEKGYRIFIHPDIDQAYELKLGEQPGQPWRVLRMGHNLFRLWQTGEFRLHLAEGTCNGH